MALSLLLSYHCACLFFYICLTLILQCLHGIIRTPEVFIEETVTEEEGNVGKTQLEFFAVEKEMHTEDQLTQLRGRGEWGGFRVGPSEPPQQQQDLRTWTLALKNIVAQ